MTDEPRPFVKAGTISEAGPLNNGKIPVLIRASTPDIDDDGDEFLPDAWSNEEDKRSFLQKGGCIDYNHLSYVFRKAQQKYGPEKWGYYQQEILRAMIGEPIDYYVDSDNVLCCKSELFEENQYVRDMMPALKAGTSILGASVGGIKYPPTEMTKSRYPGRKVIDRARLKHIAICPLADAKNRNTGVELLKSRILADFLNPSDNMDDFIRNHLLNSEAFVADLCETLKSHAVKGDHRGARKFMESLPMFDSDSAELLATEAVLKWGPRS